MLRYPFISYNLLKLKELWNLKKSVFADINGIIFLIEKNHNSFHLYFIEKMLCKMLLHIY